MSKCSSKHDNKGALYRDFLHIPTSQIKDMLDLPSPKRKGPRGGVVAPFPEKLYRMLEDAEKEDADEIVSWQTHGRCFFIHQPQEFVDNILPRFFRQTKLASFQRQLNLYGFARVSSGRDRGGYYHELFLKGRPGLCHFLLRSRMDVGTGKSSHHENDSDPDLWSYPPAGSKNVQHIFGNATREHDKSNEFRDERKTIKVDNVLPLPNQIMSNPNQFLSLPPLSSCTPQNRGPNPSANLRLVSLCSNKEENKSASTSFLQEERFPSNNDRLCSSNLNSINQEGKHNRLPSQESSRLNMDLIEQAVMATMKQNHQDQNDSRDPGNYSFGGQQNLTVSDSSSSFWVSFYEKQQQKHQQQLQQLQGQPQGFLPSISTFSPIKQESFLTSGARIVSNSYPRSIYNNTELLSTSSLEAQYAKSNSSAKVMLDRGVEKRNSVQSAAFSDIDDGYEFFESTNQCQNSGGNACSNGDGLMSHVSLNQFSSNCYRPSVKTLHDDSSETLSHSLPSAHGVGSAMTNVSLNSNNMTPFGYSVCESLEDPVKATSSETEMATLHSGNLSLLEQDLGSGLCRPLKTSLARVESEPWSDCSTGHFAGLDFKTLEQKDLQAYESMMLPTQGLCSGRQNLSTIFE